MCVFDRWSNLVGRWERSALSSSTSPWAVVPPRQRPFAGGEGELAARVRVRESLKRDLDLDLDLERDRAAVASPTAPSATTLAKPRALAEKVAAGVEEGLLLFLFDEMTSNGMVDVKNE